jgi:predicted deacylase
MSHILDDLAVMQRTVELAKAFGAPYHVMNREVDGGQTFAATAERMGVIYMSSEFGGGNRVNLEGLAITRRGVANAMIHLGLTQGTIATPAKPTRPMVIPSSGDYGFAPERGIYAPRVPLGAEVASGDLLGEIHRIDDPMAKPSEIHSPRAGLLWCIRGQGRINTGDCSAVVVTAWDGGRV